MYRMSINFTNILFLTRVIYTSLTSEFLIDWTLLRQLYKFFSDQGIKVIYPICNKHIAGTISARIAQDTPIDIIVGNTKFIICGHYDGVQ